MVRSNQLGSRPGIWQRLRRRLHRPGDVILSLHIGLFIWLLPRRLRKQSLPRLLDTIRTAPRPAATDIATDVEQIIRLRTPWLRRHRFGSHNTCYVRALCLYRFLDPGEHNMRIHLVVEPPRAPGERMRGHAWVTVDNQIIEEPQRLMDEGLTREVYSHPLHARPREADEKAATADKSAVATARIR